MLLHQNTLEQVHNVHLRHPSVGVTVLKQTLECLLDLQDLVVGRLELLLLALEGELVFLVFAVGGQLVLGRQVLMGDQRGFEVDRNFVALSLQALGLQLELTAFRHIEN